MAKFWFEQFLMLSLAFPENDFNFVTQKVAKNWKMLFWKVQNIVFQLKVASKSKNEKWHLQTLRTFVFDLKVASKQISIKRPMIKFWYNLIWTLGLAFPVNDFVLTGIHSIKGWTPTTMHGVTRKRSTKRLNHTGSLFREKPAVNRFLLILDLKPHLDQRKVLYSHRIRSS